MRGLTEPSTFILAGIALILAGIAYAKDPGLPWVGVKNGLSLLGLVPPRLKAILMASVAGALTPGGPMVTVPLLVVLANSGAGLASLAFPILAGWLVMVFHSE